MDPNMSNLLKWSIENSSSPTSTRSQSHPTQSLNANALQALMGGPSDADLMRSSMSAIQSSDISLDERLIAFDNFEQLIETIDNANNMGPLGLWTPLVELLNDEEIELRRMAAWCVGTAVQNNIKAQERLLVLGAIPKLVKLAVEEKEQGVRRKAVYALSSEVRNYQPAVQEMLKALPGDVRPEGGVDAGDMEAIDAIMERLREGMEK